MIVRLSTTFKPFDEEAFYEQLERQVGRYFLFYDESSTFSAVMGTTLGLMHEYGLRLNQDLTLAIKAMIQAEEAALLLDPTVEIVKIAIRESQNWLTTAFDADAVVKWLTKEGLRSLKEIVRRLPSLQQATMKWLDQYERGRLTVELDTSDLTRQIGVFAAAIQFLSVGFILAGIVIATAIAAAYASQTPGPVYQIFLTLFFVALAITLIVGWRMIRRLQW